MSRQLPALRCTTRLTRRWWFVRFSITCEGILEPADENWYRCTKCAALTPRAMKPEPPPAPPRRRVLGFTASGTVALDDSGGGYCAGGTILHGRHWPDYRNNDQPPWASS